MTPVMMKFVDGFQSHEHEFCSGESSTHIHNSDIDCGLCKLKFTTHYFDVLNGVKNLELKTYKAEVKSQYHFTSDFKKLQTLLRGPPLFT